MDGQISLVPLERIERAIIVVRGEKVMLDSDLAEIYGVETKRVNEQVRRNINRFPSDFVFQLCDYEFFRALVNQRAKLFLPKRIEIYPHLNAIQWHRKNIFHHKCL